MRDMKLVYQDRISKLRKQLEEAQNNQAHKQNTLSSSLSATPGYFLKQALSPNRREIYTRGINNSGRVSHNEDYSSQNSREQDQNHQQKMKKKLNPASPQSVAPKAVTSTLQSSITPKIFQSQSKPVASFSSPLKQSDLQEEVNSIQITSVHTVDLTSQRKQRSSMKHVKRQSTNGSNLIRANSYKIGNFEMDEMDKDGQNSGGILPIQTPKNLFRKSQKKSNFDLNPISNLEINLNQQENNQRKKQESENEKGNENSNFREGVQLQDLEKKQQLERAASLMSNSQFDSSTSSFQFMKSRSNSKQSYFSICSDIGSISGNNIFKPPGLVSLDEKSSFFYKSAVFLDKGVLFEDYRVQIGFLKSKVPQALCYNIQIFVGNKNGSYPMMNFEIKRKEQALPQNFNRQIVEAIRKQEKVQIKFAIQQGKSFIAGPLFQMKFEQFNLPSQLQIRVNEQKMKMPIRLPMLQIHFVETIPDFANQFSENKFQQAYTSMNNQVKLNFTPDFNRLKSISNIEALLKHKNKFSVLRPKTNSEYVKGGIYFGCTFGNSLFFRQMILGKIKIRPNLNQSQIAMTSNSGNLTRAVMMGILELLTLSGPNIPNF